MTMSPTDDHGDTVHPTRIHELLHTCRALGTAWADPAVDVAAVLSIAWVLTSNVDPALAQIGAGAISSVAVGKRWIGRERGKPGP